jgi:3-oxoacyl-[acyl-carrier protein] reductase
MGAIRFSRLCIPAMRKVGGGRIINITMIGGKQPGANNLPTSTSRAAGIALTKALSKDVAVDNILVNTVCVGKIRSGQHERRYQKTIDKRMDLDAYYASLSADIPLKRFGLPEEVGDLVAFLASERAKYITGDAINIDGGTSGAV